MKRKFSWIYFCLICLWLAACQSNEAVYQKIDSFSFIDQNGESFGTEDLEGKIWIADFIFTNCATVCQPMTMEMAHLQDLFHTQGLPVEFVSFSVDPTIDHPNILKEYILGYTSDTKNWHLLTGYSQAFIEEFAREQFNTIVQKPEFASQVLHGTDFYLIDQKGNLRGVYNYIDQSYIETLTQDVKSLTK